jgi:site-specific recombinase
MLLKQIISIFKKFKQYELNENKKTSLDLILAEARPELSLESRIEWIQKLVRWIRNTDLFEVEPEKIPAIKLKYLFMVLERNLETKNKVSVIFKITLQELRSIDFFCEVGLPSHIGLIGEIISKMTEKILPKNPIGNQLSELMITLFPDEKDVFWLKSLDNEIIDKIIALFGNNQDFFPYLKIDMEDSLIYLTSQIAAIGLGPGIRKRIPHKRMKALPFFYLSDKLNIYLEIKNSDRDPVLTKEHLTQFSELLKECERAMNEVYSHLDNFGVSTDIVFQLERMKLFLNRTNSLLEIVDSKQLSKTKITNFIAELVELNLSQRSALGIFSNNATLLSQKIIESNSHTGEHYIAKDRGEYWRMIWSAIGGGALTSITIFIKNLLVTLGLKGFFFGTFAALNYAGSFLVIQFTGSTLATKQPAATAAALAEKLGVTEDRESIESVTDEIVLITRTQIAAIVGNLVAVIPAALLINFIYHYFKGTYIFSMATAEHNMHTVDIFGPSIIFAIFTGFLLWLSSVFAGWAGNWYSFHQLSHLIISNKKIKTVLTQDGAHKFANFLEHGITGIAGNTSLGILMGLFPELLNFMGIPLEVRHVTLSTGALAASIPTLGIKALESTEFLRAVLGILLIGTLNVGVSFSLALAVAFKAKKISAHRKALIYRSVLKRFYQKPFSFFIPKSST